MCLPIADQPAIGEIVTVSTHLGLYEGELTDVQLVADTTGPRVELLIDDRIRAYGTDLVE